MKARAIAILALVLSLSMVPLFASMPAHAQSQYNERLDVYTAGQNAFWSITLNHLAADLPAFASAESTGGLSSYRLVAMSSQSAISDYQVFGIDGYNLLNLPSTPSEGLFLMVTTTGGPVQSSMLSAIGNEFGTSFSLVSSSGDASTYFAPVDFSNVAVPILYKLIPSTLGGFAGFASQTKIVSLPMPFIELTATNNGTGFTHEVSVGADASTVVSATGAINLSELIGSTNASISSSSSSNSSEVVIHSLDGLVYSTDKATVSNHVANFSGSYSLSVPAGEKFTVNATIESQPPTAVAYRVLDHGALNDNGTLGVTVVVSNTASSGVILNATINDNWWKSYPNVFQLSSGNYSFTIPSIAAGTNMTETYVLNVISAANEQITIPATTMTYTYVLSSTIYNGRMTLGEQFLQMNNVQPSLSAFVRPSIKSGTPLGTVGDYVVTITNTGNSPALNVRLGNNTVSNIAQNGGTSTIKVPIQLNGLQQVNFTKIFSVQYTNTAGVPENITTNSVNLVLSHTGMILPFVEVTTNDSLTAAAFAAKTLDVTYTFTNAGKGSPSSIAASESFPTGVSCKVNGNGTGVCSGNTYTMSVPTLTTQKNTLNLTFGADNYIIPFTSVTTGYEGMQLHTFGGTYIIPAGITLSKSFNPTEAFPGMTSTVTLGVSNVGTVPVFNATIGSSFDSFDKASNSSFTLDQKYAQLVPGNSSSFTYQVVMTSASFGNVSAAPVVVSFTFAGASVGFSNTIGSIIVYQPPTATVTSSPSSPEESHDFTLTVSISNPSPVTVSDVSYTFTLPAGVTVVSGATLSNHQVTITVPSMNANSTQTMSLTLSANMGLTIDTSTSHLTFQYLGSTLTGLATPTTVTVGVDLTTRYEIPIAVAVLVAIVAVVFVRRRVGTVAGP